MAYTVKKGDTLSKLYGKDWAKLSGYTGDPTKLQIGTQLNDLPGTSAPTTNTKDVWNNPPTPYQAPVTNQKSTVGDVWNNPPTPYQTPVTNKQMTIQNTGDPTTPPVTPTGPIEPPPIQTDLGGLVVKERQRVGMPVDEISIKQAYRDYGLEDTMGAWKGSKEQWKALGLEDVNASFKVMQDRIAKEGIQNNQEQNIVEPGKYDASTGEVASPTYEYNQMGDSDYGSIMDGVVESIGTTDLTRLIQDFAGGDITTPELELSKEDRDAKLDELKTAASQGLSTLQKGLAAKGMTFSGIRTESEANLAAEVLAKESGIGREFAGKIINAARQEQGRRETALKAAETNYNKALEAQGYVYNPFTNTIEKTMERQKFEADENKEAVVNYPNSYDEYQLAGAESGTGMTYAKWLDRNVKATGGTTASEQTTLDTVDMIMSGSGSIWDLTPTERTKVKIQANKMGLFDETVPTWFKEFIETTKQQSVTKSVLQQMWDEYRAPMTEKKPDQDMLDLDQIIEEESGV